jgi:hypothetical protein
VSTQRVPNAMLRMISEVHEYSNGHAAHEPDGFGVWRMLVLDMPLAEVVHDLLLQTEDDRIEKVELTGEHEVTITFAPDRRADSVEPFHLDRALRIYEQE